MSLFGSIFKKKMSPREKAIDDYNRKKYNAAFIGFMELARNGDAVSQFYIGVIYYHGYGVCQSYEEAVEWYRLAADQGYALAQYNLGIMYENGTGVPQSYDEAVKWYRLAADQGYADAQEKLKAIYESNLTDYSGNKVTDFNKS